MALDAARERAADRRARRGITAQERELRRIKADHPYILPLLTTVPGIAWVLGFTIASELGEIERFASPEKLTGYTGLCLRIEQSGERDWRAAQEERAALPALGADRSGPARRPLARLPRALPAHQAAARQTARRQGGGDRRRRASSRAPSGTC
jgi:transposase